MDGRRRIPVKDVKQIAIDLIDNPNDWIHNLTPIIDDYKDGQVEQLDEEDVDNLVKILKAKINLREGNISMAIYDEILG